MQTFLESLTTLSRPMKRAIQITADSAIIILCLLVAMSLRLESLVFMAEPQVWLALLIALPPSVLAFSQLGLYRSVVRFITVQALPAIAVGVLFSAVTLSAAAQLIGAPIPRSVPGIYAVLLFLGISLVRFVMRGFLRQPGQAKRDAVVIYGAGAAGRQLCNALNDGNEYRPVAFVDDDPALQQTLVSGKPVIAPDQLPGLLERTKIAAILLAIPSASRARRREIVTRLEPLGVELKTLPGMADIVSGAAGYSDIRRVRPEDLLGRDPVPPRADLMGRNITGKVVLVSGAGGSIGSELCRQILRHNPRTLVLMELSEIALYTITTELRGLQERTGRSVRIEPVLCSVQNRSRVSATLRAFGVQTIYHAAAYKHVILVEENTVEGVLNNVIGTRVLAQAATELQVEDFILISTDKAVRPTNVMGASKRMAELVCQALAREGSRTRFSMVRFGNVLGSSGSVIPRFKAQIQHGGPVTVTHKAVTRYFMTIPEAAQLVIQAGAMSQGGDVFVLDMGEPVRILDLAQSMIRLHGLKPYIMDGDTPSEPAQGDIGIRIVGLGKGEKLYEELLIGNAPKGTEHPRIMTATEHALPRHRLDPLLDRLQRACHACDVAAIQQIFLEAPLAYRPARVEPHDLIWNAIRSQPEAAPVPLALPKVSQLT